MEIETRRSVRVCVICPHVTTDNVPVIISGAKFPVSLPSMDISALIMLLFTVAYHEI